MQEQVLRKYSKFLNNFPQEWENISGLAYTSYRYFYFANVQRKCFLWAIDQEFKEFTKPEPIIDYSEQCYSHCYAFYVLIRTCLEVSSKFSDKFQENSFSSDLKSYRDSMKDRISKIINIANDYIKHPVENKNKATWYEPGGFDSDGMISINEWAKERDHFESLTISLDEDFNVVLEYLERLAEFYIKQLSL